MSESRPASSAAPLDQAGRIRVDAPCLTCGYNLRTLEADATCPECGRPVIDSLRGGLLRFADPAWVRKLASGLLTILIALLTVVGGSIGLTALSMIVMAAVMPTMTSGPPGWFLLFSNLGQLALYAVVVGILMVGILRLSARDPQQPGREPLLSARRLARVLAWSLPLPTLVALAMLPAIMPLASMQDPLGVFKLFQSQSFWILTAISAIASLIVYGTLPLVLLRLLANLLRRIPRPGLTRFAQVEFWGLLVSEVMLVGGYAWIVPTFLIPLVTWLPTAMPTSMPASGPFPGGPTVRTSTNWPAAAGPVQLTYSGSAASQNVTVTATTSMPASVPMPVIPPPPIAMGVSMVASIAVVALGGCGANIAVIAAIVLLILAQRALSAAAREAAGNAGLLRAAPQGDLT